MKAVKLNRVYTITEAEQNSYIKQGYDILDDNGVVLAYGAGKTISYEKYMKVLAKYEDLLMKYAALENQIPVLEKEIADLKKAKKPVKKKEEQEK